MQRIDLDRVRARLATPGPAAHAPTVHPAAISPDAESARALRRAAVAMIVRPGETEQGAELLFIRRAEDPRDPWSGHMAFPGGRHDPADGDDLLATAARETREEIGLSLLDHGEPIGRLPDLPAIARGRPVGMLITPWVFALRDPGLTHGPDLAPNKEVAAVVWAPLAPFLRGEGRTVYPYRHEGHDFDLPGYRLGDRVVWGLTYQMLETFLEWLR